MSRVKSSQHWEPLFREYISHMSIDSKETGITKLTAENIYGAQNRFLSEVCAGLDQGIRDFKCLKARQLGITTITLPIDVFWLSVFEGTQGCLMTDDEANREKFRIILRRNIESLPKGLRVGIKTENRNGLVLNNGSTLDYVVAGKKKRKGGVAVSRAYNFLHATEVSNYGDPDAIDDFLNTLALTHPNRLYIYESTARGFNMWYDMYRGAKDDPITQKAFFIGWWAKEVYSTDAMPDGKKIYKEFWDGSLSDDEKEKYKQVRDKYGVKLKSAQVAWHRFTATKMSETAMAQSYPWTEDEAFVATGQSFFPLKQISADINFMQDAPYKAYRYHLGGDFLATNIEQVMRADLADLRVWEEPHPNGVYAIGVDPAFGRSEHKDRHAIEIWRCYADRLIQVAEYATDNPETYQVAWVLAHLCGVYRNCMVNLEITGPGGAIVQELRHLRDLLDAGALSAARDGDKGVLLSVFDNVRWYLWNRPDSPGRAGYVQNWKCLALDTPLPTPTGWTTMGAVQSGDLLFDERGKPTQVLGCSPVKIGAKCYRMTFDDGTEIIADEDHLWKVWRNHWRGVDKIRKTKQLAAGKFSIRRAAALDTERSSLPINPYTLGVWLGDGYSANGLFCAGDEDMDGISQILQAVGESLGPVKQARTHLYRKINGLKEKLITAGLRNDKHIPAVYLRASAFQRELLLAGLMDTDGSVARRSGQCSFTTTSIKLRDGFAELLRSLGIKAKCCVRNRTLTYGGGQSVYAPAYQFWFQAPPGITPARLPRKAAMVRPASGPANHHRLVAIEEVPSVPVKCVKVDSPSCLFLAGAGMIPTHNTNSENKTLIMNQLRDAYATKLLNARSIPLLEEMSKVTQDGDSIEAAGRGKDDRVFAAALANKAWYDWLRPGLISNQMNYKQVSEAEFEEHKTEGRAKTFHGFIITDFFKQREMDRQTLEEKRMWANPYYMGSEQ